VSRELEFERPILKLERQISELRDIAAGRDRESDSEAHPNASHDVKASDGDEGLESQIQELEERSRKLQAEVFGSLSRWQIVQLSRHPERPYTLDYVSDLFTDFCELHGDRGFADDGAIVAGLAKFAGDPIMIIGHQKGRTTKENMSRNFGMARPEGYRKAMRLMSMAERFNIPVVTFIDTPGAYPGIDAEERGQAQAIAESLEHMAALRVPIIAIVIGEGGSGGALAIGVANRVLMFEYATYSVISPEACSSILFKDPSFAEEAAEALRLTAIDLTELKVIDEVIGEPAGGAHRSLKQASENLAESLHRSLGELKALNGEELVDHRYKRFRQLGVFVEDQRSAIGQNANTEAVETGRVQ
jgi:acetyl-CoA carboxylase carboxyl transferase subunit alpha